jgi:hypothetical protein
MNKRNNWFNVQIAFETGAAFGLRSESKMIHTPEEVVSELKWFIERAEAMIAKRRELSVPPRDETKD